MTLRIACLRTLDEVRMLSPAWDALDRSLELRTPFTSPAWNLSWWQHLRADRWSARDELRIYTLHDAGDALVAVAPMVLTSRPAAGPLRLRELRFFGADANLTELRGLACLAGEHDAAYTALLQHVAEHERDCHQVTWSGIRRPESDWCCDGYQHLSWRRTVPDFYLDLPGSWDEFRAALPRNIRESLRKCYNSLARDGHAFEFRVITDPQPARAAIAAFFALHASRARASGTVRHADVFREERARSFLLDYAANMAARDELRIFQLVIDGQVVATRIGFQLGQNLYLYYSGFNPAWSHYSVMTTVVAEAIQWSIQRGVRILNLSTGDDVSKTRWRPERVLSHDAVMRGGTRTSRACLAAGERARNGWRRRQADLQRWLDGRRAGGTPAP